MRRVFPALRPWILPLVVGLIVAGFQLWLVGAAGNATPLNDEWDREGGWLYPRWVTGELPAADLFQPHNEHRILWTYLLDLGLFTANGQWDPRMQLLVMVLLRALIAVGLARWLASEPGQGSRWPIALLVAWLFLPHLAWQNVLWGFQTQVYFSLGLSLLALHLFVRRPLTPPRWLGGLAFGVAAQWGMSAGAFVPVALAALLLLDFAKERKLTREACARLAAIGLLGLLSLTLRTTVPELASQRAGSLDTFFHAFGLGLSWPYPELPWLGVVACLPLAVALGRRLRGRPRLAPEEDFALALGCFGFAAALAQAFFRGGAAEFSQRIPSRYAEFMVLLALANAWCVLTWLRHAVPGRRLIAQTAGSAWFALLAIGWLGTSTEVWRKALHPRIEYRDVPGQLVRQYQLTGHAEIFTTAGRFFQPYPEVAEIGRVLSDPRMHGHLPPTFQPEQPPGPLSRAATAVMSRAATLALILFALAGLLALWEFRNPSRAAAKPAP